MDDEELCREVWGYVEEFTKEIAKLESKLPYNVNVIDELHANENAHSRILIKLLQYPRDGKLPILESFKSLINGRLSGSGQPLLPLDGPLPNISGQQENIDALIEETKEKSYAIIIENKICDATDQPEQIDRYVESVKNHGFKDNSIYVIYLTKDGSKEVTDYSFDASKKILDYKDNNDMGRFIPLDYRNNILPWLEKEVLPHCMVKEEMLISALQQYIDYLKGSFDLRIGEMSMANEILDEMFGLKDSTLEEKVEKFNKLWVEYDKIYNFISRVKSYRDTIIEDLKNKFIEECKSTLQINEDSKKYYQSWDYLFLSFLSNKTIIKGNNSFFLYFEIKGSPCGDSFDYHLTFSLGYDGNVDTSVKDKIEHEFENDINYRIQQDKTFILAIDESHISREEYIRGLYDSSIAQKTIKANEDIKLHLRNIGLLNE